MTHLRARIPLLALGLLAALACATQKPAGAPSAPGKTPAPVAADDDGTPAQASPLGVGTRHADTIDRARGDLDDWFKLDIPRPGTLTVIVEGPGGAALPNLTLALTDATGATLATPTRAGGRPRVGVGPRAVQRGVYLIWVGSESSESGVVRYELHTTFTPAAPPAPKPVAPPPPPKPRFETKRLRLVELSAGGQSATISGGRADGITIGIAGRLLDKGAAIAQLRVVEVYERGSRVRLDPPVTATPSSTMSVEIDVPLP